MTAGRIISSVNVSPKKLYGYWDRSCKYQILLFDKPNIYLFLSARVALELRKTLLPTVDNGTKNMILNFAIIAFIGSSALDEIVGILKQLDVNGNIVIFNANGPVSSAFKPHPNG